MRLNSVKTVLGMGVLTLLFSFQNCSNAKFTSKDGSESLLSSGDNNGEDGSCIPTDVGSSKVVKVLFLVDTSGSNVPDSNGPGTDPQKQWRTNTLTEFIRRYNANPNFYYGLITFQGSSAKAQITTNNTASFSNDPSVVDDGVNRFKALKDTGGTPYKAALTAAKSLIQKDLSVNSSQKASYVVVMISDGQAKDYKDPSQIIPDVSAIKNLAPSQISLNSVYYYAAAYDESQTKYLKNISTVGGGSFITANANQTLNIDNLIRVPPAGCQ